ncbi:MAG: TOBE domain-containing protein, partial [Lachnospiraceae bacterium]|nr:TOBE domain-containing protein [Lachnospiraceae bacterium]
FIYITHDQEEALNMSDRIAVMKDGRFVQIGTAQEIYDHPRTAYVARFVGNANIIHMDGQTLAVRSENVILTQEPMTVSERQSARGAETSDVAGVSGGASAEAVAGGLPATVKEKSFVGGMLRITLGLEDGTEVIASRHGIDAHWEPGQSCYIYWNVRAGVPVTEEEEM